MLNQGGHAVANEQAGPSSWTHPAAFQQQRILDLSRCRSNNGHQNIVAEARTISLPTKYLLSEKVIAYKYDDTGCGQEAPELRVAIL